MTGTEPTDCISDESECAMARTHAKRRTHGSGPEAAEAGESEIDRLRQAVEERSKRTRKDPSGARARRGRAASGRGLAPRATREAGSGGRCKHCGSLRRRENESEGLNQQECISVAVLRFDRCIGSEPQARSYTELLGPPDPARPRRLRGALWAPFAGFRGVRGRWSPGLAGSRGVADPRPATRDPGRNQRPATRDPERPGPPGPARTYPARPGHTRPGPDICQDRDFKIIL